MEDEKLKKVIGYGISAVLFAGASAITAFLPEVPSWATGILSAIAGVTNLFGVKVVLPSKKVKSDNKKTEEIAKIE